MEAEPYINCSQPKCAGRHVCASVSEWQYRTDRIAELERLTAMSVESLAYIRGIAEKGGEEEVPDSAPTHQAILGYVMFLEAQLAAAQERERTLRDALDNMVRQFACTANGKRSTGGRQ